MRRDWGSPLGISRSTSRWVLSQTGTALASNCWPLPLSCIIRLRLSAGSGEIFTSPRRTRGFNAAVNVVRSMASREATGPIGGGTGRLRDIKSENCPFVRSNGRSASSNRRAKLRAARCTCKHRQQSRTKRVVSYGTGFLLDTRPS
jgi:hypothetical protein